MAQPSLLVRIDGHVARLTLNRPEVRNAFDAGLIAALAETLAHLRRDPRVRVVLLSAAGSDFCAGADLRWMRRAATMNRQENRADAEGLGVLLHTLDRLPLPTVALVRGSAYGGGLGLLACCDIVVAAVGSRFCFAEVRLGLVPAIISPYALRAIGQRQARRYFLSAEAFDADTAVRLGLVHEVVGPEALANRGEELCRSVAGNGPAAMAATKKLIAEFGCRPVDKALVERTVDRTAEIRVTEEAKQGIDAFLAKKPPPWRRD